MSKFKIKISVFLASLSFLFVFNAKAATAVGLVAEHVKSLNTLALSFVDLSQPMYAIKLQIMSEFLNNSAEPKLILLVTDDRDIKNTNAYIQKQNPKFDVKKIQYVKSESTFLSSPWMRDFSPMMILKKDGTQSLVTFKYENDGDYAVDQKSLAVNLGLKTVKVNLHLEGGNTLADEDGRLYISAAVVENNLAAGFSEADFNAKKIEIENILKNKLLAKEVVWIPRLDRQYEGTGHVDMYIRFLKNKQAVVALSKEPKIASTLDEIAKVIASKGFKVSRLQANAKMVNKFRDQRIFPSYTNSILVGESIFIPKFGVVEDKSAVALYQRLGYKVIQIDGESIHFGGSVHCLTYLYP